MSGCTTTSDTAHLIRQGQELLVAPPLRELIDALQTRRHQPRLDEEHGYGVIKARQPLFTQTEWCGLPAIRCGAGLELVVRMILARAHHRVETKGGMGPLLPPTLDRSPRLPIVDNSFLETVQEYPRALVRTGANVDPARLAKQIAWSWRDKPYEAKPRYEPFWGDLSIVVVVSRVQEAYRIRDMLLPDFPDTVAVTGEHKAGTTGRIAVTTFGMLDHSPVNLAWRDVVIVADALHAIGKEPQSWLRKAVRARMYGLLYQDARPAPWEWDQIVSLFGFEQIVIPRHGFSLRPVQVVQVPIAGGAKLAPALSTFELKRQGVWQHDLRNRRIAKLAQAVAAGEADQLRQGFQIDVANVPAGRVVVLVESVDHGLALARRLPGWPLLAGADVCQDGLSREQRGVIELGQVAKDGCWNGAIVTTTGLASVHLRGVAVIVNASGGKGVPPLSENELTEPNNSRSGPLWMIDFDDRYHPQLRRWSRWRQEAYAEREWYRPGVNPVRVRVEQFFANRPAKS